MSLDDYFNDVNSGKFRLRCPSARLFLAPGYHELAFEGTGILNCTNNGYFEFELFVKATDPVWLNQLNHSVQSEGKMESFQLQLMDENGKKWVGGEWVFPYVDNIISAYKNKTFVIKGKVNSIVTSSLDKIASPRVEHDIYQFIIADADVARIPWQKTSTVTTQNHESEEIAWSRRASYQTVSIDGIEVTIEQIEKTDNVKVTISSKSKRLPAFIDIKVLESLMFVSGRLMNPVLMFRKGKNQKLLRLVAGQNHLETRQFPPIFLDEVERFSDYWSAFEAKLTYLLKNDAMNPFFYVFMETLIPVMEASSRSEGIHTLTLSVAVEAIVRNYSLASKPPQQNFPEDEVQKLKEYIQQNISDKNIQQRLDGAINSISSNSVSTKSKLRLLAEAGVITRRQLKSWETLRHKAAHGDFIKLADRDGFGEIFGDVITLVNKVILKEVGYDGYATDYGKLFAESSEN